VKRRAALVRDPFMDHMVSIQDHTMSSEVSDSKGKVFSRLAPPEPGDFGSMRKTYWLVRTLPDSKMIICPLNTETWAPEGISRPVTRKELQHYILEPGLYEEKEAAILSGQKMHVARNLASIFDRGLSLAKEGNMLQAREFFTAMLRSDGPFEEEHKHIFNDCAIQLRKNSLNEDAIAFYSKMLKEFHDEDENLHINFARVLCEQHLYAQCVEHLLRALNLAPSHPVACKFLAWLGNHQLIPPQYIKTVRNALFAPDDGKDMKDMVVATVYIPKEGNAGALPD
jgi:tetratricopeptide (TPR) repeat protein